ncbi:MAG TPA: GPW/gp25 family protein [Micromonosporaceae bacterium]|nr:GPW/gp25 family protein [Micromonosporaceae bacterium]
MDFTGRGWFFPLDVDKTGSIKLVSGDREIVQSIHLILATAPGERPMRPEFGCAIHDLVFAPADAATAGEISYAVRRSLAQWEPRITVDDVIIDFAESDQGTLLIDIRYTINSTNDPRNLVFPFYVIPSHEPSVAADGGVEEGF